MITAVIMMLSPFIVNVVTQLVKRLPTFESINNSRNLAIRALAGFISVVYVVFAMWVDPNSISDDVLANTFVTAGLAFVTWLSSLGSYHTFLKE